MSYLSTLAISPAGPRAPVRRSIYSQEQTDGSEEGFIGNGGINNITRYPRRDESVAINRQEAVGDDAPKYTNNEPMNTWDAARVATFLEEMKVAEETIAEVVAEQIDGSMLAEFMNDSDAHAVLAEALLIKKRTTRTRVITHAVKYLTKGKAGETVPANPDPNPKIFGEKVVQMPVIPQGTDGQLCDNTTWKLYCQGVKAWAALNSEEYALICWETYSDPGLDAHKMCESLNSLDKRLDRVLGSAIISKLPVDARKLMHNTSDYEDAAGTISGLKLLTLIGRKINARCQVKRRELYNKVTRKEGITDPTRLQRELDELNSLCEELRMQGGQFISSDQLYITLDNMIQPLMLQLELMAHLIMPVNMCKQTFPEDWHKLRATLAIAAEAMIHEPGIQPRSTVRITACSEPEEEDHIDLDPDCSEPEEEDYIDLDLD